jgi:hypothetical protein
MYNSFNFISLINSMACIPEYNLATLYGFNTFLLKIILGANELEKRCDGRKWFSPILLSEHGNITIC